MKTTDKERWLLEKMAKLPDGYATRDLGRSQYQSLVDKGFATRISDDGWTFLRVTPVGRAALTEETGGGK